METLQEEMHPEGWQSSRLIWVRNPWNRLLRSSIAYTETEMLTPIDQPLDKLEDLDQEEM